MRNFDDTFDRRTPAFRRATRPRRGIDALYPTMADDEEEAALPPPVRTGNPLDALYPTMRDDAGDTAGGVRAARRRIAGIDDAIAKAMGVPRVGDAATSPDYTRVAGPVPAGVMAALGRAAEDAGGGAAPVALKTPAPGNAKYRPAGQDLPSPADIFAAKWGDASAPPWARIPHFAKRPGEWEAFNKALDAHPGLTEAERLYFRQAFAWEGGTRADKRDPDSHNTSNAPAKKGDPLTSSGITPAMLKVASGKVPALNGATDPKDLTLDQRVAFMKWYLDNAVLKNVDGVKKLSKLGDDKAAAAVMDVFYRHGQDHGTEVLQEAINRFGADGKNLVEPDGEMGSKTWTALENLLRDTKTRDRFLDTLADVRVKRNPDEKARIDHFRPDR